MSEPLTPAHDVVERAPGLVHWSILDERIGFRSEAYAFDTAAGRVFIDPLPLSDRAAAALGAPCGVVITGAFHQRAAWSIRRRSGVEVWAPAGAVGLEEPADRLYADGDRILGGLDARVGVGPRSPHAVLGAGLGSRRVLWCGDLVLRGDSGPFALVPDEHRHDPAGLLAGVRRIARDGCDLLCPAHGAPLMTDGTRGLLEAVESEERRA